jgi:hypothetical protein
VKDGAGVTGGAGWGAEEEEDEEDEEETAEDEGTRADVVLGMGTGTPVSGVRDGVRDGAVIGGLGRG